MIRKDRPNFFKIGVATNPQTRFVQILGDLVWLDKSKTLLIQSKHYKHIETLLHSTFNEYRADKFKEDGGTEWFEISAFRKALAVCKKSSSLLGIEKICTYIDEYPREPANYKKQVAPVVSVNIEKPVPTDEASSGTFHDADGYEVGGRYDLRSGELVPKSWIVSYSKDRRWGRWTWNDGTVVTKFRRPCGTSFRYLEGYDVYGSSPKHIIRKWRTNTYTIYRLRGGMAILVDSGRFNFTTLSVEDIAESVRLTKQLGGSLYDLCELQMIVRPLENQVHLIESSWGAVLNGEFHMMPVFCEHDA